MKNLVVILTIFLFYSLSALAQGGPPMVTDDPATVSKGHWEINISSILAANKQQALLQLPHGDFNYGLGDHTQLKVETGLVIFKDNTASTNKGLDAMLVGVKYRFVDEESSGIAISTYPQFQFHYFLTSKNPELIEPGSRIILPIDFSKTFGTWAINPEIGIIYGQRTPSELIWGMVLAYENFKPFEPLFEIHANSRLNGSGTRTLLNYGSRYTFNPNLNLIFAVGYTVTQTDDALKELNIYFGLQLEI